jgi:stearoyl-CoA desaturase (delta-9 desaturase)
VDRQLENRQRIDWVILTFFIMTPILMVASTYLYIHLEGFNPLILVPAILYYLATGLSITAGYHRLFAHRSYEAHFLVRLFFLLFGAGAFQWSAMKWCTDHRRHHNKVDTQEDPYSVKKGFFWAHMGWLFREEKKCYKGHFAKDLKNDPLVRWQHKYILPLSIFMGFIFPTIIGHFFGSLLGGFAIIGLCRMVFVHHSTFLINSLCHTLGKQTFTDTNTAKDNPLLALFTYGEGYHNFHHFFQTDYRNGINFFSFDPTKWLIRGLSFIGLTWGLKTTGQEDILKAKLNMEGIRLKKKLSQSSLDLTSQIVNIQTELGLILEKIKIIKKEMKNFARHSKRPLEKFEIKRKLALAKLNLKFKLKEYSYLKKNILYLIKQA